MKIDSITIKGFRCFGDIPKTIKLSDGITAFVGANGSGKTAVLEALLRVFGITAKERTILRTDFHTSSGIADEDSSTRELYIEIRIVFPGLSKDTPEQDPGVPVCFNHMVVFEPNGIPIVRVRLEAKWIDDGTVDGDIEQKLFWIPTPNELPTEQEKIICLPTDRARIQVHYIPAIRDPSSQLTSSSGAMIGRLLKAIEWSSATQESIKSTSKQIREVFGKESAINTINQTIESRWKELHSDNFDAKPELNIASRKFEDIVSKLNIVFSPTEFNGERDLDALSDGQRSLFYFSLVASIFEIERKLIDKTNKPAKNGIDDRANLDINEDKFTGFHTNRIPTQALTIFAFEEPENHLAPYFLSRIIKQVQSIVNKYPAQAVITSHSPAILGRIEPEEIRHFRLDIQSRTAIIKEIKLPSNAEQEAKYVREAVKAYPELYFAKFVILGEGDSEQILLPKLASAMELDVDPAFVAIVPLGGRHVNHFWKLLNDLKIPYATLLDLDIEREGGGWGRIKYALKQLLELDKYPISVLKYNDEQEITDEELEKFHEKNESIDKNLLKHLEENFGVFYSQPLDIDMMMLSLFLDFYKSDSGLRIPDKDKDEDKYNSYIDGAKKTVLRDKADLSKHPELKELEELLPWYRYLFLGKSKPSTHIQALCKIESSDKENLLRDKMPPVLKRLLKYTNDKISADKTI
ncbi:AAA family ATPase [Anabaena cylindrica UHCC 0172]|uniref:ATP-dependent nuclease n=1 Tax=Anabaena cylindrica TaxID=1165 RepID=UPI002B208401|nr:AAA family ATPase [Anabaena cylindrica]MEA5551310.1 AAA family ATPase [Anabaena cylindrica UHCC 0172]